MAAIRALRGPWNRTREEENQDGQQEIFFSAVPMRQLQGPFWQPPFGTPLQHLTCHDSQKFSDLVHPRTSEILGMGTLELSHSDARRYVSEFIYTLMRWELMLL